MRAIFLYSSHVIDLYSFKKVAYNKAYKYFDPLLPSYGLAFLFCSTASCYKNHKSIELVFFDGIALCVISRSV